MSGAPATRHLLLLFTEVFANGGIQRFNRTFIEACRDQGVCCTVLSLNDTEDSIARNPSLPNITVIGFTGNRSAFAWAAFNHIFWHRYDWLVVGHINFLTLAVAVLKIAIFHRTPAMMIAHGIEVWSDIHKRRGLALSQLQRLLCVSRYTRQRILDQAPHLDPGRLRVFPNALAEVWRNVPAPPVSDVLPERFILSVTRLDAGDRYKGIVTTIEALEMLADKAMKYVIVGHGNDVAFLKLVVARCRLQDRVLFLRGLSDAQLINLYRTCAAFVLPSGKEGFGIVYLEAMYFDAPVIAAGEKGALDVIRDGETGLLVRFGDSIGVKNAIERITSDLPLRARLRARGHALVEEGGPFTFSKFVQRFADAIELPN